MRLTPEQLRDTFAREPFNEDHAILAIRMALDELEWHPDPEAKSKSPYSIAKLTRDLRHRDRIIDLAIREAQRFKGRERIMNMEIPATKDELDKTASRVDELMDKLRRATEESEDLKDIRNMGFLKRLRFLFTKRL